MTQPGSAHPCGTALTDSQPRLQKAWPRTADVAVFRDFGRRKLALCLLFKNVVSEHLIDARRTFDERLVALEAGLADPERTPALDALILDLLRAVEDEAEASAKDAAVRAQRSAEAMLATAMAQAQDNHAELDKERARSASLTRDIESLKKQLAAAADESRRAAVAAADDSKRAVAAAAAEASATASKKLEAAVRERDEIARTLHARASEQDAIAGERDALAAERDSLLAERTALAASRDSVAAERDAALAERDAVQAERDALALERDARSSDRHLIVAERDALAIERNALVVERNALMTARDTAAAERERLMMERNEFVRTHDAMILQRDTLRHERDEVVRDRDAQIAQLREALEARDAELKDAREKAVKAAAAATAAQKTQAAPAPAKDAAPAAKKSAAPINGPIRKADRHAFASALGVQIDGEAALLVDLSVIGAQVLSCSALKPDKTVKMLLPSHDTPVLCRARIVWARLEPTKPGKPIRYRAGMFFTATDQAAVQTFMARHGQRATN